MHIPLHETPADAVRTQVEKIISLCHPNPEDRNSSVHEIRKSLKRIKALFWFLKESDYLIVDNALKCIRTFNYFLSPIRESFVNINFYNIVTTEVTKISEKRKEKLRQLLVLENERILTERFETKNGFSVIENFAKEFEYQLITRRNHPVSGKHLFETLWYTYEKSYQLFQKLTFESDAEKWHNLRKKLKVLWYETEFLINIKPRYFKLRWDRLNLINDELGEDHDLFVFSEAIVNDNSEFTYQEKEILANRILKLRSDIKNKLQPRLVQIFSQQHGYEQITLAEIFRIS